MLDFALAFVAFLLVAIGLVCHFVKMPDVDRLPGYICGAFGICILIAMAAVRLG